MKPDFNVMTKSELRADVLRGCLESIVCYLDPRESPKSP